MKVKILTIVVLLVILASSIAVCKPKESYLVQVMKLAPEDTLAIGCTDIKALANDPDLEYWYDGTIDTSGYMMVDIDASDISASAAITTDLDYIFILTGDFNLEDARDALTEEDFVEGEYRGVEIWTNYYEDAVAFIDNMVIAGDKDMVEACIRIHNNEEPSMYDNEDMKAVVDKLPVAIVYMVFGPDVIYSIEVLSGSFCWRNLTSGDGVLDMLCWFKFDNKASAEAAMTEGIEDDLSQELGFTITDAHLRGQFIEVTGEVEIPDY